ncbi:STAS/SEC14 domain-containing protein [Alienimonas sp. DA493]|uniref:STAS/SEC14 domain-containing protein n=1 Tax=Alienimonas sp. DA493 TaxID=3373605 RepID=UPI0037546E04
MIAFLEVPALPSGPALLEILVDDQPAGRTPEDERCHAEWTAGRVQDALTRRGGAHVLQEVRGAAAFDAASQQRFARFAARYGQQIGRLALVGEPITLRRRAAILEPLIGGEVRCFDAAQRAAARRWLTAG